MNRNIYLYITTGWFIWSKKVIPGSLQEHTQLVSKDFVWLFLFSHLSFVVPLVLMKSVSVNLLQVAFEFQLQWVDQQNMIGLLIQQLGGPRDRCQDRHQAGHATIVELLLLKVWTGINRERCLIYLHQHWINYNHLKTPNTEISSENTEIKVKFMMNICKFTSLFLLIKQKKVIFKCTNWSR